MYNPFVGTAPPSDKVCMYYEFTATLAGVMFIGSVCMALYTLAKGKRGWEGAFAPVATAALLWFLAYLAYWMCKGALGPNAKGLKAEAQLIC